MTDMDISHEKYFGEERVPGLRGVDDGAATRPGGIGKLAGIEAERAGAGQG